MENINRRNPAKEYWLDLIIDYLTGAISDVSRSELEEWIEESEDNRKYFANMQEIWSSMGVVEKNDMFDKDHGYKLFEQRIHNKKYTLRRILSYAAVIIPFIFLSYFTYSFFVKSDIGNVNLISKIVVPNGSKSQIELKDGTQIWLNAGSTLSLSGDFGKIERRIKLYGEAYLEVAKNIECPFIVETDNIDIKVLGTKFNVNTYKENEQLRVGLLEGAVELLPQAGESIRMKPNDLAMYDTTSGKITIDENGIKDVMAWKNNQLVFTGQTFSEIVYVLERNFNVKINIHRELIKTHCFFGDFVNNETIEQVVNVMASNKKFTYKIKGNTIDIY